MSQMTKRALVASLKDLLAEKPLDKITVTDLTEHCGVNRMTFYYHFKDIYDLVEWACIESATRALAGQKTYDTWQEGLQQIFEAVLENKPFILNVYRSVKREQVENYMYSLTYQLTFPSADVSLLDGAASLVHMMNLNTFTCGAFHVSDAGNVSTVAADIRSAVQGKQWMCGFPDKLVIFTSGQYVVSVYGNESLVNTFRDKFVAAHSGASTVYDEAIGA